MDEKASFSRLPYWIGVLSVDSWFTNGLVKHRNPSELSLLLSRPSKELHQFNTQRTVAFPKLEGADNSFVRKYKGSQDSFLDELGTEQLLEMTGTCLTPKS